MRRGTDFNGGVVVCIANIFVIIISGWALKMVDVTASYCRGMFPVLLVFGIIGIFTFTKPDCSLLNPIIWNMLLIVQLNIIPICVITDAYEMVNISRGILYYGALVTALLSSYAQWKIVKLSNVISGISVTYTSSILLYLYFFINEGYWIIGFVTLMIFNQLILTRVLTHYDISYLEFRNIALCFYVMFSLNAIGEFACSTS